MFLPIRIRHVLLFACFAPFSTACSKSVSTSAGTSPKGEQSASPTEVVHEECDVEADGTVKTDANNDGRADISRVMAGNRELCRVLDLNFDGKVDNFLYFDEAGKLRRRESDFDRDGLIDEIGIYQAGRILYKHRETNLDGKLDTWDTYKNGRLTERRRDTNADGKVDQWWTFPDPTKLECPVVATDEDGDGKPDARHDPCKEREAEMQAASEPWGGQPPEETAPEEDAGAPEPPPAEPEGEEPPDEDGGS